MFMDTFYKLCKCQANTRCSSSLVVWFYRNPKPQFGFSWLEFTAVQQTLLSIFLVWDSMLSSAEVTRTKGHSLLRSSGIDGLIGQPVLPSLRIISPLCTFQVNFSLPLCAFCWGMCMKHSSTGSGSWTSCAGQRRPWWSTTHCTPALSPSCTTSLVRSLLTSLWTLSPKTTSSPAPYRWAVSCTLRGVTFLFLDILS